MKTAIAPKWSIENAVIPITTCSFVILPPAVAKRNFARWNGGFQPAILPVSSQATNRRVPANCKLAAIAAELIFAEVVRWPEWCVAV
jgi:hypothetical protein